MKREIFNSKWGFILTSAGSAIGLGNIWRFPYLCGQYGGLSFILMYLFIIVIICNPLMVSEIAIGRTSRSNCVDAYQAIGQQTGVKYSRLWSFFGGWFSVLGILMCLSFYFLVASWVLYYFLEAVSGKLLLITQDNLHTEFESLTQSFSIQYCCGLVFLLVTALIVMGGVQKGLEKTSVFLMPVLFFIFLLLTFRSVTLDGADNGVKFLLHLDPYYLGFAEDGFHWHLLFETFTAALGQAFISLSLGFGILLVYGSYFSSGENLFFAVRRIEFFDTLAALLSSFIILPAIFSAGIASASGPGLTFISLPLVFQKLAGGHFWAFAFYLLLMLATITSTISNFEMLANLFMSKFNIKRFPAVLIVVVIAGSGFTAVTASFSGIWGIKVFGKDLFALFDWLASTYTASIVSLTMALFVGYQAMKPIIRNIRRKAVISTAFTRYFLITLRYVAPIGLSILLLSALYD